VCERFAIDPRLCRQSMQKLLERKSGGARRAQKSRIPDCVAQVRAA
jgi:hypothetical protein